MDLGTYVQHEGRPAVRFVREYPHPVDRVWRAVSDPAELPAWFPSQVELEGRTGGRIRFTGDPYAEPTTGTVLTWDPPHRFAFTWGEDELHLSLEEVPGGCRLTLVDVLDDRSAAARNGAGWHVCLDVLATHLHGLAPSGPHGPMDAWLPVLAAYESAGLPSGAPIPVE